MSHAHLCKKFKICHLTCISILCYSQELGGWEREGGCHCTLNMCGAIDELPSSTSPAFQPRAQRTPRSERATRHWQQPQMRMAKRMDGIFIPISPLSSLSEGHFSSIFGRQTKGGREDGGGNNRAILQFDNNNDRFNSRGERDALIVDRLSKPSEGCRRICLTRFVQKVS